MSAYELTDTQAALARAALDKFGESFGYEKAQVDALIDIQSVTLDQEVRQAMIKDISRILLRDNAKIVIRMSTITAFTQLWVQDYYKIDVTNMSGSDKLTRTWIDQEMKEAAGQ